jgi:HTH-type transcriptional regulator/antitoxin MqsA
LPEELLDLVVVATMKCPKCVPTMELVWDTRDLPYTYKGETTLISAVTGDFCPGCEEAVLDMAESARVSAAMLDFNKQVNASIVDHGLRHTLVRQV